MEKIEILSELSHKRKTISDIIRYIRNVSPNGVGRITPNYSILLGSGASVTSGVRSGEQLVKEWKLEVLGEIPGINITSDLDETWKEHAPEWYDPSNSYSSLFEHQYDLQRQRRIFVEKEVSDKDPSIGYAYLVRLVSSNYFNTVFTTNFDDLLNEAFYRFSTIRPMVCAHDSSISGVTVTSERPKIIKLHGDYLFDNIKTTLRETESLETNMRMKFKEFARDFGLIVVGYSGQDRSIMDILSYLLDQESYFKNGIYWCVRKGTTEISNELKKLLWKDRVYFVEIDGFDEFMAELNNSLNEGNLPVDDSYFGYNHQEQMIKKLVDNHFLNSTSSAILKSDMAKIKQHVKSTKIDDFMNFLIDGSKEGLIKNTDSKRPSKRSGLKELTKEQKEILSKIKFAGVMRKSVREAICMIQNYKPLELEDSQFKLELLKLYIDLLKKGNDEEIKMYADEIIRINPDDERHYIIASKKSVQFSQGYEYLKKAISKFENDFYIHNRFADCILDYCEEVFVNDSKMNYIDEAIKSLETSLSLYKCIENEAYLFLIRAYQLKYANNTAQEKTKIEKIWKEMESMSDKHINVYKAMLSTQKEKITEDTFQSFKDYYIKADSTVDLEYVIISQIKWIQDNGEISTIAKVMEDYESSFIPSGDYQRIKSEYFMRVEEFDKALELIDATELNISLISNKMEMLYYMGKDTELDNFYNSLHKCSEVDLAYYSAKRDDENIIKLLESKKNKFGELTIDELVSLSFSYLKLQRYQDAESLLKPYYVNPQTNMGEIIINYLFANHHANKQNLSRKAREKIIDKSNIGFSNDVLAVAYHFSGEDNKSLDFLAKELKRRPVHKYDVLNWPVLSDFKSNPRFQKLTEIKYKRDNK